MSEWTVCRSCKGSRAQHSGEETCWCRACVELPEQERCTVYDPMPAERRGRKQIGRKQQKQLPRAGTRPREVFDAIGRTGGAGLTKAEVVEVLAVRRSVVDAAFDRLIDSKVVKPKAARRIEDDDEAVVWVIDP